MRTMRATSRAPTHRDRKRTSSRSLGHTFGPCTCAYQRLPRLSILTKSSVSATTPRLQLGGRVKADTRAQKSPAARVAPMCPDDRGRRRAAGIKPSSLTAETTKMPGFTTRGPYPDLLVAGVRRLGRGRPPISSRRPLQARSSTSRQPASEETRPVEKEAPQSSSVRSAGL